jgi:hypothetical protein
VEVCVPNGLESLWEYIKTNWWVGCAVGGVLLVLGWKMTATLGNVIGAVSWAVFVFAIFRAPIISDQPMLARVLWTTCLSGLLGVIFYYTIWTPASQPIPLTQKAAIADAPPDSSAPVPSSTKERLPVRKAPQQTSPPAQYVQNIGGTGNVGLQGNITINGPVVPPPRLLSSEKGAQLVRRLKTDNGPTMSIDYVADGDDDGEASKLTHQLTQAFGEAGWAVNRNLMGQMIAPTFSNDGMKMFRGEGLHCAANDSVEARKALAALAEAGLKCELSYVSLKPGEALRIMVGRRLARQP